VNFLTERSRVLAAPQGRNYMGEPRPEKVAVVTEVRERLSSSNGALLTEYRGLKVSDLANLRRSIGDAGGEYRIFKNTLVRRAASELGLTDLEPLLVGPTAVAFVDGDAVAVAKALRDFARTNPNLTIKGGLLGTTVLSAADAGALADVAPREVILAQLAGAFAAPLVKMAGLLQALPRNFAYGLSALLEKRSAEAPPAAEAPAPVADAAPAEAPEAEVPQSEAPQSEATPSETSEQAEGDQ
jgi:large subunit ribosomal protein L10